MTHEVYVPNQGLFGDTPNVEVFSGTCTIVGTISLPSGAAPFQAAFNPSNNYMYVTDQSLDQVYEISGTTILSTITGFNEPLGITYDYVGREMVVVNGGSDQADYIVGTSAGFLFPTGLDPYEIAYDYTASSDLVTNSGSGNVTVYQALRGTWFSVNVGSDPTGIAYSVYDGFDYVANTGSNTVTVLAGLAYADTITGFDQPKGIAFDQSTLHVYVTNYGTGKVFAVSTFGIVKKYSTAADSEATGLVYDDFNDKMFVTGYGTASVYVLS